MAKPTDMRVKGTVIRYDAQVLSPPQPRVFDVDWLHANQHWRGSTQGRSQAHFFHYAGHDMVLRHFHRGGLMGRVNRDLFARVPATRSRGLMEYDLLTQMRAEGLPVPRPVAARYVPFGLFYRADIITERIDGARPLQDVLLKQPLAAQVWTAIGVAIRDLHDHDVFHSDLNCRNIMLDDALRVWFIDFDKCEKRAQGSWTRANLDRLHRSLTKTQTASPDFSWTAKDWANLEVGYAAPPFQRL